MTTPEAEPLRLQFEGRVLEARPGDTVAAALLRAGEKTLSRSSKYHRPRGAFCLAGVCTRCAMRIDGEPNVPACLTPVRDGMRVERQNQLGPDGRDLLRAIDYVYREGFDHHHLMTRVKLMNDVALAVARRLGGTGRLPVGVKARPAVHAERRAVVVIGAGPAGLAAAQAAAVGGAAPLVFEARSELGGHAADGLADAPVAAATGELAAEIARYGGRIVTDAPVVGLWEEGGRRLVLARGDDGPWLVDAQHVVVATGTLEQSLFFANHDLPGIVAGRGLLRLGRRQGFVPGRRAVVVGSHPDAAKVAAGLRAHGVQVAALLDPDGKLPAGCDEALRSGWKPVRAAGALAVEALEAAGPDGATETFACELVAIAADPAPAFELAAQAGAKTAWRPAGFALETDEEGRTSTPWVFAAGHVTGDPTHLLESGRRAGRAAALGGSAPVEQRPAATGSRV